MSAMILREDRTTGEVILEPRLLPRLLSVARNLAWVLVIGAFVVLPAFFGEGPRFETLFIVFIIVAFTLLPVLGALFPASITLNKLKRTLTRTTRLIVLPVRATTFSFKDLTSIEVQLYRDRSGRSSRDAYRVNAVRRDGVRIALDWDGKRDEMLSLAKRISAVTGVELVDGAAKRESTLEQLKRVLEDETHIEQHPLPRPAAERVPPSVFPPQAPSRTEAATQWRHYRDYRAASIESLEQAAAASPNDPEPRYRLARGYHARGDWDRAIKEYGQALRFSPSRAEIQNDLGVALHMRGKRKEAEAAFRRAAALDPFSFTPHINLAQLLRSLNRAAEASQEFFLARQNARGEDERRLAEQASSGAKFEPRLSGG